MPATNPAFTKELCDDGSEIHIEIWGPLSPDSMTRAHHSAHRGGMGADIRVTTNSYRGYTCTGERKGFRITWNVNSGRGWRRKPWACTRATEPEALAFATEKWEQMLTWLRGAASERRE